MSTALAAPATSRPTNEVTFGRVVRAEWIKFRSVRSTFWTLPITAGVMVGLAVLQAWGTTALETTSEVETQAATIVTGGWFLAQAVVSVLAVLMITGEYSAGMIRSTFAAVPRRLPALWAKALVLAVAVALVSAVAVGLSWLASLPFLGQLDLGIDLGTADDLRLLVGTPLYLATIALLALAVGALIRHSAGAIALMLGMLLVVEGVLSALPFRVFEVISPFLPSTAGARLVVDTPTLEWMNAASTGPQLTPWQGYAVLLGWVVVLSVAAAALMRRRDA